MKYMIVFLFCSFFGFWVYATESELVDLVSDSSSLVVQCDSDESIAACQKTLTKCTSKMQANRLPIPVDDLLQCNAESLCKKKIPTYLKGCILGRSEALIFGTLQMVRKVTRAAIGRGKLFELNQDELAFREMVEANKVRIREVCGAKPDPTISRSIKAGVGTVYLDCRKKVLGESSLYNDEALDGILRRYFDAVGVDSSCYNSATVGKNFCDIFTEDVKLEGQVLKGNVSLGELRQVAELAKRAQRYADAKNRSPKDNYSMDQSLEALATIKAEEERLGVLPKDQTEAFLVTKGGKVQKTPLTVVIYHGLFNSPDFSRWYAKHLFEKYKGKINVINVRVAGHYTGASAGLDTVKRADWVAQSENFVKIAGGLGDKPVYLGHSNGAILAMESAMGDPNLGGVLLYSPAMKVIPDVMKEANRAYNAGLSGWGKKPLDWGKSSLEWVKGLVGKKKSEVLTSEQEKFAGRYISADASIESNQAGAETLGVIAEQARLLGKTSEEFVGGLNVWLVETEKEDVVDLNVNKDLLVGTRPERTITVKNALHRETLSPDTLDTEVIQGFSDTAIEELLKAAESQ